MLRHRDGRRLWIQSEDGGFEPVRSRAGLVERERGQGIPDWWVVAKDPDWTPPGKGGGFVFRDGAAPAGGGHMKPNSSGQLQPYDNLGQYASPRGGSGSGIRGDGWTETSGQGQGLGRTRGTSLLSMGGGVLDEDAPEQPGPRRNQDRGKSLLSAGSELLLGDAGEEMLQGDNHQDAVAVGTGDQDEAKTGQKPKIYTYKQPTGEFSDDKGKTLAVTYSGYGEGKNNPAMQHVPDVGPMPAGDWEVVGKDNSITPDTIILRPVPGKNSVFQTPRIPSTFRGHGEYADPQKWGTASKGCLILSREIRMRLQPGDIIRVVP